MKITSLRENEKLTINMQSLVEVKFFLTQTLLMKEKCVFENDKLISSENKRKKNGELELDNHTNAVGNYYYLKNLDNNRVLSVSKIDYNFLKLYFHEPLNRSKVYSDSFQTFLNINKVKDHHYNVTLPNKDYNEYFYNDGICTLIKIHTGFFKVEMKMEK